MPCYADGKSSCNSNRKDAVAYETKRCNKLPIKSELGTYWSTLGVSLLYHLS